MLELHIIVALAAANLAIKLWDRFKPRKSPEVPTPGVSIGVWKADPNTLAEESKLKRHA